MTEGQATERFKPYKFVLLRENLNHAQFSKKFKKGTITQYLFANNLIDECISWLKVRRTPSPSTSSPTTSSTSASAGSR